jgi:long-chain acyl-CoA synthetase
LSFNLATILRESRQAHPDKPLCHVGDRTFSYAEIDRVSGQVAAGLDRLGIGRGDKVAVQLPNLPEFLFSYFGILKAGAVMVPLNPLLRSPEIAYHLQDCEAKLLITFEAAAEEALKATQDIPGLLATYVVSLARDAQRFPGTRPFDDLCAGPHSAEFGEHALTQADDTAVIIYTSGTTGKPKGAELTHFQMFMNCTTFGQLIALRDDDVIPVAQPMFHVFALSGLLNSAVRYGGTLALLSGFEIEAMLDVVANRRCTIFSGIPPMYIALLSADIGGRDLSALRVGLSGGSPIPAEVIRAVEAKFPTIVILEGYGLSEAGAPATYNISATERKAGSVGKPVWGVQVKVIDDDGTELSRGPGHIGEIVIRGHNVMKGYYRNPKATAEALRGGWFHTGDLGYRDEDGYLFIVDRKKDLIMRDGNKIYPREVEEALYEHPAISRAAVIGKPGETVGQDVRAFVVPKAGMTLTAEDVIAHCTQRLAAYKHPGEVRIVDSLPVGPTGKVAKKNLRV